MPRKTRKMRGRRVARRPHYNVLPIVAASIFIVTTIFSLTPKGKQIEALLGDIFAPVSAFDSPSVPPTTQSPDYESELVEEDLHAPADQIFLAESAAPDRPAPPPSAVKSMTVTGSDGGYAGSGTIFLRNNSKFDIDVKQTLAIKNPVKLSGKGVQVLIMHTHGSEAYTPDKGNMYKASDTDRTTDNKYNMIRVGDEIEKILAAKGIKVLHSRVLNDSPAYSGSYNRALDDITAKIKANPSIKVVIDVHRDAMVTAAGTKYKTVANINGTSAAQLMFVTGTNGGGLTHDKWRQNLSFQMRIQDKMNTKYPGIMRPINIRNERFNQHVTTGSMLLEVGTSGNSLDEAIYSAKLFASVLADTLNGK